MRPAPFSGQRVVAAIIFLLLLISPPLLSSFLLTLLTQALIYAILAMSLDIILGYTGLASLGHAAYFGLGAYSVGILATRYGAGFWVTLPAGVLLAVAVAAIFGLVALRSTGVYFLSHARPRHGRLGTCPPWVTMTQGDNGFPQFPPGPWTSVVACPFLLLLFRARRIFISFWILRDCSLAVRPQPRGNQRKRIPHENSRLSCVAS
jgi:ABC-type branched-subunit amino acid transport system permease subunit